MRALTLLLILFTKVAFSANFSSDSTSKNKSQPDSVTKKIVYLLLEAREIGDKKPAEALKKYRTALTINKLKDDSWEANVRLEMGRLLHRLKSKDATLQLVKAEELFRKKANLAGRAQVTEELAKVYESQGLYSESLKNYNALYKIHYRMGEAVLAGNVATALTDKYLKTKNYTEAFHYADMAKTAYYSVCRMDSLGSIYYRIASIKKKTNNPKSAEYYILNQALPYYRSSDDLKGRQKCFDFLGQLYKEQKKYSEAKWFYLQANNQALANSDTANAINSLINLSVVKIHIGDLALAKQDWDQAKALAKVSGDSALIKSAKVKYADLYKKLTPEMIAAANAKSKAALAKMKETKLKEAKADKSKKNKVTAIPTVAKTSAKPAATPLKVYKDPESNLDLAVAAKSREITASTKTSTKSTAPTVAKASVKDSKVLVGKKDSTTKTDKKATTQADKSVTKPVLAQKQPKTPASKTTVVKQVKADSANVSTTKKPAAVATVTKGKPTISQTKQAVTVKKPTTLKESKVAGKVDDSLALQKKKDTTQSSKVKSKPVLAQKVTKAPAKKAPVVKEEKVDEVVEVEKYENPLPYERPNR